MVLQLGHLNGSKETLLQMGRYQRNVYEDIFSNLQRQLET